MLIHLKFSLFILLLVGGSFNSLGQTSDYFAIPNGTGNGSQSSPFSIASFWPVAKPGDRLILKSGTYKGSQNVINPPSGKSDLTIIAESDGGVLIDGESARMPVALRGVSGITVQGINACKSSASVCLVDGGSTRCRLIRVCAWDAPINSNSNAFRINDSNGTLVEDCAGWGLARKTFDASAGGNNVTFRRCWGRWEGSTILGPKMTFTVAYNSYGCLMENCIAGWSAEKMPSSYVLYCNPGATNPNCGKVITWVDQPDGLISMDREDGSKSAGIRVYGSIAYIIPGDRFLSWIWAPLHAGNMDNLLYDGNVSYIAPGTTSEKAIIFNKGDQSSGSGLIARNNIAIGGGGMTIDPAWQSSNNMAVTTYPKDSSIYSVNPKIRYRVENGSLTNTPLWPWPMEQRISDALALSGRSRLSVTGLVTSMFGPPPTGGTVISPPPDVIVTDGTPPPQTEPPIQQTPPPSTPAISAGLIALAVVGGLLILKD